MNQNQLKKIITVDAENPFEVELTGLREATTAVIFVHGFGVKRQSRGLFLDIEALFPEQIISVRAEFSKVLDDRCIALPFPIQCQRLHQIIDYLRQYYSINHFIYIGHSQGCITIALEQPKKYYCFIIGATGSFSF